MSKDNPNLIRECYTHDTGDKPEDDQRAFMDWCEIWVLKWKDMISAKGYDRARWSIPEDHHGTLTYHEWLKEKVSL